MLFRRRTSPGFWEMVKVALWPRRSFARSGRYVLLRLWRLSGSPHAIAVGCAAGVFIGFTPFLGFQFMLAAFLAWILGGSIIAATLGTFVANPLSFPLIWIATHKLGCLMLTGQLSATCSAWAGSDFAIWSDTLVQQLQSFSLDAVLLSVKSVWPVIMPMALGSLPLGVAAALATYFGLRHALRARRRRLPQRMNVLARQLDVPGPRTNL
jgi:uncharacterized protein (DUF2062 family)